MQIEKDYILRLIYEIIRTLLVYVSDDPVHIYHDDTGNTLKVVFHFVIGNSFHVAILLFISDRFICAQDRDITYSKSYYNI